ncbi:hypothetical protein CF326_g9802 [Tilletia indica]|uniref:Uncharacterized protein n=1 Tax=Tilletia indica TaxID=43049 RepID=A0A177SYS5_9BASI|nr:hypothetical protein CF326_g9802 [Tilletia indica]KAE8236893.1 hypothetical protein A4X13_0g8994 [Tilletia indica]
MPLLRRSADPGSPGTDEASDQQEPRPISARASSLHLRGSPIQEAIWSPLSVRSPPSPQRARHIRARATPTWRSSVKRGHRTQAWRIAQAPRQPQQQHGINTKCLSSFGDTTSRTSQAL